MKQIKETLYGEPKNGKAKQWTVFVDGDKVVVQWGRVGGKLQEKVTVCTPKNIGKKNETSPEQQALLEAKAKWVKQHDNKLYRITVEEASIVGELLPMLAIDGSKKPEKIVYPCHVQPKLDGVRCMVYKDENGIVKAISRQGKFYHLHTDLECDICDIMEGLGVDKLDGELYIHGMSLQNIVSAVRNTDNPEHYNLQFHVFDLPSVKEPWSVRSQLFHLAGDLDYVKIVPFKGCASQVDLHESVGEYMAQGFEGTIVRNTNGMYEFNHRSNDLIKVKTMFDSEAKVLSCVEDKNGQGKFKMGWKNTEGVYVEFDLSMNGSRDQNTYNNLCKRVGEWVCFQYQALTDEGKPQFPRGLYFRECDENGNPFL